jgi:hypothetical protein
MTHSRRRIGYVVVAIALAFLVACGGGDSNSGAAAPTPTPTQTTFEEPEWTIVTPVGWTREDVTSDADATKAVRYRGSNGDYVIVHIDPQGSDFAPDVLWRYEVRDLSFEIVEKEDCTGEQCSTKDARFDGYALWKANTEPSKVGGRAWYFAFGNATTTTVDQDLYEEIIESVRVKG